MNAIGDKLLKAAEKTGNKQVIQSVKKAERAETQRKEAKAKAKQAGKAFKPATKSSHGVTKKAVKAATGNGKVVKTKPAPKQNNGVKKGEEVLYTSDGGKTILPKFDASMNPPIPGPKAKPVNAKTKDTLTDRGVNKLAGKGKPKQQQHAKKSASEKHLDKAKTALKEVEKELKQVKPQTPPTQQKQKLGDAVFKARREQLQKPVSKAQPAKPAAPKKPDPKPQAEGSATSHSDYMSQLRNSVKRGTTGL